MLRVAGLALLLVIGVAAPAEANGGYAGEGSAIAPPQRPGNSGPKHSAHERTMPLQLTSALSIAPLPLQGASPAGGRREFANGAAGLAALSRERRPSAELPWLTQGKSGLKLPVSERLSFAFGYRYLQGEDLWRWYAEAGAVEYASHDFILRAYWRF
jgi:hypothetical protein